MVAIIKRDVNSAFGSGKEQSLPPRIFANNIHIFIIRYSGCNFGPGRTRVARAINVWPQVVKSQGVNGSVSCARVEMTGIDDRNFLPGFDLRRRDVGPMRATISSQMDQAVIRSGPDSLEVQRRWRYCINDAALRGLRSRLRSVFADGVRNFESLARKIGTNLLPVLSAISCLPQGVGSEE